MSKIVQDRWFWTNLFYCYINFGENYYSLFKL